MPSGMHASSPSLRWSLQPRTTAAIVATGLLLLLFTVSRRIWRGGGRKVRDPGGTKSNKKVKEKNSEVLECVEEEEKLVLSNEKLPVNCDSVEPQPDLNQTEGEELLTEEEVSIVEDFIEKCIGDATNSEEQVGTEKFISFVEENSSDLLENQEEEENPSSKLVVESAVKEGSDNLDYPSKPVEAVEKGSDLVSEELVKLSIIPEVCGLVSGQEVVSSTITGAGDGAEEGVKEVVEREEEEVTECLRDIKAKVEETGEENSSVEKVEQVEVVSLTCGVVAKEEEKDLQGVTVGDTSSTTRNKRSVSVEQGEGDTKKKEVLERVEEEVVMQVNASVMTGGKKKSGKKNKEIQKVELEKMEVKDMERNIVENEGDVEEHQSKCEVSTNHPMDSSGIGSPSMSNFPDNRSEGSSCGDSGKGRSDVTTPGGLEEEEREVSFPRHFSPPCSTSGPEEEEEDSANVAAGDGSLEDNSGEAVMLDSQTGMLVDGSLVPVGVPLAVYPGIVPILPPSSVYEFVIPQTLVGRLIGKHGSFVNLIKARTSANIFIKTHPESSKLKVCAIEGTDSEIQAALEMIREKFPVRRYSSMTLEQVFFLPLPLPSFSLVPDSLHLQLVEGVSNDVILSAMVSPSHFFLQQPTHPTYPTLAKLDMWMAVCYQDVNAPALPDNVEPGIICAAPTMGGWYRTQIVAVEEVPSEAEDGATEEGEIIKMCDIRFVDYGGYERLPAESLRQIRSDFMTLPFQASECYLASVVPAPTSDENKTADGWSMQAYSLVEELTQAQVIQAQVVGHSADGLPLVFLYAYSHSFGQVIQVNHELVRQGLAVWAVPMVDGDQVEESASEEFEQPEEEAEAKAA